MIDLVQNFIKSLSVIDIVFLFFILINLISGFNSGFISSLFSFFKWIASFLSVKFFLPELRPYLEDYVDSKFLIDVILSISLFIVSLFIIIIVSRSVNKVIKWTGLGPIDKIFGLFFGVFKGYVYFILIFTISTIIYPLDNWNKSFKSGNFVNQIIYGKDIIVDNFPKRQDYIDDGKKKIKKLSK